MVYRKLIIVASAGVAAMLIGCVPAGWREYRAGMRCHFKDDADCAQHYEEAIKRNPLLPGVHSSYGAHLYTKGLRDEAEVQLRKEAEMYPQAKKAVETALNPEALNPQQVPAAPVSQDEETEALQ